MYVEKKERESGKIDGKKKSKAKKEEGRKKKRETEETVCNEFFFSCVFLFLFDKLLSAVCYKMVQRRCLYSFYLYAIYLFIVFSVFFFPNFEFFLINMYSWKNILLFCCVLQSKLV